MTLNAGKYQCEVRWVSFASELERGVTVSDDGFSENEEAENNYLEGIRISNTVAEIETTHRRYKLDLRHVGKSEVKAAMKVLKKMNYDRRFKLTVI